MILQFTHDPSFACKGGLRKPRADCSAVGLYITVAGVLLHETVERRRLGSKFKKSVISRSVTNVAECQTTLMQTSFHAI